MNEIQHERELRAVHREVVLALMGTFDLYAVAPDIETAAARALIAIVLAHPCGVARPRAARGRAALRFLLNEIERPDLQSMKSSKSTQSEATNQEE